MTISSLTYSPPIRRHGKTTKPDYEVMEAAAALADEGRNKEAVQKVFEHLFPTATIPDLATSTFSFTQGSSRVSARIQNDELSITVPLIQLPAGGSAIAALRYVLTKISGSGQLHQPRLHGDNIYLEFKSSIAKLHPAKVLEALRRMPMEADANDDWLIGQFSAVPLERGSIVELTDDEAARAEAVWRSHWDDIEELVKESQRKRSIFFLNELTAYAVYRIRFVLPMCGIVSAKLAEAAGTFNDSDEDPTKRETTLAKCVKEMKAVGKEELRKNLGHVEYAISPIGDGTPALISDYFQSGDYMETIDKLRSSGKNLDAAIALICTYNYLLARFSWPEEVETEMKNGLAAASGKPWREAANTMFAHAKELAATYGSDEEDEDEDDGDEDGASS